MVQKKTTGLIFPSRTSSLEEMASDDWRSNATRKGGLDSEMPQLDDNDVWLYQLELERLIRRNLPDTMNGRALAMLACLGAQARRAISHENEEEDGTQS